MNPTSKEYKEYEKWEVKQPEHTPHGTEQDIRSQLKRAQVRSWRMEGNKLIAQTDMGELAQFIPTNYICEGMDASGLPKLRKLVS